MDTSFDRKHSGHASLYKEQMFEENHIAHVPYLIAPNDVHLCKDKLETNINLFSFFD